MSFVKDIGTHLSSKYGQKLLDSSTKSTIDAIKNASKGAIQKAAEATGDLIYNKIADKIRSVSKKASKFHSQNQKANDEWEKTKVRYISPEKRQQIIDELRLV